MTNLLQNGGFETDSGTGPTMLQGPGVPGLSAAAHWTVWNNPDATTTTDLLPSTYAPGTQMLHVCTTAPLCGLVQTFEVSGTGPAEVDAAVWVFVIRGVVGMGVGDGGSTGLDVTSITQGQWERLQAPNGGQPANELIVYATGNGATPEGACFYIDAVQVLKKEPSNEG